MVILWFLLLRITLVCIEYWKYTSYFVVIPVGHLRLSSCSAGRNWDIFIGNVSNNGRNQNKVPSKYPKNWFWKDRFDWGSASNLLHSGRAQSGLFEKDNFMIFPFHCCITCCFSTYKTKKIVVLKKSGLGSPRVYIIFMTQKYIMFLNYFLLYVA